MAAKRGGSQEGSRQAGGPRPLAATMPSLTRHVLGSRGFAIASVITDWESIVGPQRARACRPEKLTFPRGTRSEGTLKVRASGGAALALQHDAPLLVERINRFFGYRAVARLHIVNGPVTAGTAEAAVPAPAATDPVRAQRIAAAVDSVEDPELRDILARFGRSLLGRRRSP